MDRHFVYGENGFPGTTGKTTADLPDPDVHRANGVSIHVAPVFGHGFLIDDLAATAKVLGPII